MNDNPIVVTVRMEIEIEDWDATTDQEAIKNVTSEVWAIVQYESEARGLHTWGDPRISAVHTERKAAADA